MKLLILGVLLFATILIIGSFRSISQSKNTVRSDEMIIRISEIKIDSSYLQEYLSILKEEAEASVRLEPGVISIFPMFQKENPTEIRILEIYASRKAYESHLQTTHFKHYKTTTLKMVKSLNLIDMSAIDIETMSNIFRKSGKE